MNSKKTKELKRKYKTFCAQNKQPETATTWRRFKKLYNQYKENFLK